MDATKFSGPYESGPPYVGALLRLCWRRVRGEIERSVREAGFEDLQQAHLAVFSYPLPDGARPSELARQIGVSRQAANHTLSQLESLGYLERRVAEPAGRRLIYLTARGWRVADVILASLVALQEQWSETVGEERFADFMSVLRELADEKADATAGAVNPSFMPSQKKN